MQNKYHTKSKRKNKWSIRTFVIVFVLILFLGIISILCIYAEHYIALNTYPGEIINFFGFRAERTFYIDLFLSIGLGSMIIGLAIMLLYTVIPKFKGG